MIYENGLPVHPDRVFREPYLSPSAFGIRIIPDVVKYNGKHNRRHERNVMSPVSKMNYNGEYGKQTAKDRRRKAIEAIVSNWIGMEDDGDLGRLIHDGSFADLYNDVSKLITLSRMDRWVTGVAHWEQTVHQAFHVFCRDNEISDAERQMHWTNPNAYYTPETRKQFILLLKWAITTGNVNVWGI